MAAKRPAEDMAVEGSAKKQCFTVDTEMIKVVVGPEKIEHLVHSSILSKSTWFDKCLSSPMRESVEKVINLPEDDAAAFKVLVIWLYTDTLPRDKLNWNDCTAAYQQASNYGILDLKNKIMDRLLKLMRNNREWTAPGWVLKIWGTTTEGCQLRILALASLQYHMTLSPARYKEAPPEGEDDYRPRMSKLLEDKELASALVWLLASSSKGKVKDPSAVVDGVFHDHTDQNGRKCGARDRCEFLHCRRLL